MKLSTIGRCAAIIQPLFSSLVASPPPAAADQSFGGSTPHPPIDGCASFTTRTSCLAGTGECTWHPVMNGCVSATATAQTNLKENEEKSNGDDEAKLKASRNLQNKTPKPTTKKPTAPTPSPTTRSPTTLKPTTSKPTTRIPTSKPTTKTPTTRSPTSNPTTRTPTTLTPSAKPTAKPSPTPSSIPTSAPTTSKPTSSPSSKPTAKPSATPSSIPTSAPTTSTPTSVPTTSTPSATPSSIPTSAQTTSTPTSVPTTSTPTSSPSSKPTSTQIVGLIGQPIVPDSNRTSTVLLPPSAQNQLMTMSLVSADNEDEVPVTRSYDGRPYETLDPLLLPVNCTQNACVVVLPPKGQFTSHYIIKQYDPPAKTPAQRFARLLLQGSFGPSATSLSEAMSMPSAAAWVRDQMDKPASLLRAHYRQRANSHIRSDHYQHGTRLACERGSRWNRKAFNRWRDIGKTIVEESTGRGTWYLKIDGIVRTEVATQPSLAFTSFPSTYVICRNAATPMSSFVEASGMRGRLFVAPNATACQSMSFSTMDMPSVHFHAQGNIPSVNLVNLTDPNVIEDMILQDVVPPYACNNFNRTWPNFVRDSLSGLYYIEDRRVELIDNTNGTTTVKKRLLDGRCPQVEKNFLNEETCVVRSDCSASAFSGTFVLNAENLRKFYEIDGKYVYRLNNLPLLDTASPCNTNSNRFVRKDANNTGCAADASTQFPSIGSAIATFLNTLPAGDRGNKRVIDLATSLGCSDPNSNAKGKSFTVTIPGTADLSCWTHSYSWEWSVVVMNDWVVNHPGNPKYHRESKVNPIAEVAESEKVAGNLESSVTLHYPPWGFHQANFHNNRWRFESERVGSWGDSISFNALPDTARSVDVVIALGGAVVADSKKIIEVCGSPGEVGNAPSKGHQYLLQKFGEADEETQDTLDQDHARWQSSKMIWNTVTLSAPDQLRHRVSWALSSIFVVSERSIDLSEVAEPWGAYYDIFIRNAFGSFLKLLKEVAFSPLMAKMLTYEGSKSQAYHIERNNAVFYPDENFPREIMQLFTIGLTMLNQDGTQKVDSTTGQPIPTYDNDDIVNFARGWTNFEDREIKRDNIEPAWGFDYTPNWVDPMFLPTSEARDVFPKLTLLVDGKRGHIGDQRVPRCDALPAKSWLRKGAVWQFRENSQSLMGKQDPDWWKNPETWTPRLILDPSTSKLYGKLCNMNNQTGKCQFQSTVILDEDISCVGTCKAGQSKWDALGLGLGSGSCECSVDEPRTVRLDHSTNIDSVWYEYVRAPCIQLAFPESGNMKAVKEIGGSYGNKAMCADSRFAVAGTTCCDANGSPVSICIFKGERTTYNTARDRCAAYGRSICAWSTVGINYDCGTDLDYGSGAWSVHKSPGMRFSWTNTTCSMQVQIAADGKVAMIHSVGPNTVKERVAVDFGTYFGVIWGEGSGTYPQASSNCGGITTCQVRNNTCVCDTSVQTTTVFDGSLVPKVGELLSLLHIGAPIPSHIGSNYSRCPTIICPQSQYEIWSNGSITNYTSAFNAWTIFKVTDPMTGEDLYLSNTKSTVNVGGGHAFRNPPIYNSPVDPTQAQGLAETDAILQTYVNHPNTAPFISKMLIRNLVTSNPSPGYVERAAVAFRTGNYSVNGMHFGSGRYGDLQALVSAIMLDSEARSETLDDDPNYGRPREPLLKIIHIFRSMQLSTATGYLREIDMTYLIERGIGQEAHRAPSVFGFFLSEYSAPGPVKNKNLISPEAQLQDAPKLLSFINGLFSLPAYGLTDCLWWQGFGEGVARYRVTDYPDMGGFDCSWPPETFQGVPLSVRWKPPSWGGQTNVNGSNTSVIIDEIDLLLTGGRLCPANKALLMQAYNSARTGNNPDNKALSAAIQLFSAAPEFHITSNLVSSLSTSTVRPVPNITLPANPPPVQGYKAIVYLFMAGAADSFSMLVPTSACGTLHSQYMTIRRDIAIQSASLRAITASNQSCNSLGLHPSLANIHNLYNAGDAAWIANVGPLVEHLNKAQYNAGSKVVPQALFAHNTQTQTTQTVFAQDSGAGGVLGRIGDVLNARAGKEVFHAYSIQGNAKALEGAPGVSRKPDVLSGDGVVSLNALASPQEGNIEALNKYVVPSIHGETYSSSLTYSLYRARLLSGVVGSAPLANDGCFNGLNTGIADQLQQVARLMKKRDGLQANHDAFYTEIGGFDTHSDNGPALTALLKQIDDAIGCFKNEMVSQGIWGNVTIVSASEFARTLISNGAGTDHAWAGNYFVAGGSVKGGRIHGQFLSDFTENGDLNIGQGRVIPTTPWEGVWNALAEWFGVSSSDSNTVLPNKQNFGGVNILSKSDMFD